MHFHHHFSGFNSSFACCFHPATGFHALTWLLLPNFPFTLDAAPIDGNSLTSPCLLGSGVPQISASLLTAEPACKQEALVTAMGLASKNISFSRFPVGHVAISDIPVVSSCHCDRHELPCFLKTSSVQDQLFQSTCTCLAVRLESCCHQGWKHEHGH